nr:DUF3971 domain-containing protein [Rhizobium setariae]
MRLVEPSPAINFAARADTLSVATVKQLWPFWFGKKARHWILENIRDGVVKNAVIDVSLAAGRIPEHPEPMLFENNEMHIAFDAEGLTVKYIDTMPVSRDTFGHFDLTDRNMRIDVAQGTINLPSGKRLAGSDGVFEIADTAKKPLAGALDIKAVGEAAAAAEFASFKPINAMSRFPVSPADLTGKLSASIRASFGLDHAPSKVKPDWNIVLDLDKVGLKTPFDNRKIANVEGKVTINTEQAVMKGKADVDGMGFDVVATEPIDKDAIAKRDWQLDGRVSSAEVLKLAPTLAGYFSGNMDVNLQYLGKDRHKATLSLTSADLSIPLVGWRKGPGVPAKAEFELVSNDGRTEINDLVVSGDGFGARGDLTFDAKGLVTAKLNRVRLASSDNFALSLTRKGAGLSVGINGDSIDMRSFLDLAKSGNSVSDKGKTADTSNSVSARIDRAIGYNNESLTSVNLDMVMAKGAMSAVNFSAVTRSGQAVVIRKGRDQIEVTSGDAGAVGRFADIYRNMNGGLLNVNLKSRDADSWHGSVDIRNFALVNEARLKSIVSARAGEDGRSLSDAVKADIDVSSQKFRRGFARLLIDGKLVRVENGVVRGDEVGATFQGTVRDADGMMAMTGTFMPAYGLNRLFSELPLIGVLLGNGRDRGLLGITFKLVGPYDQPALSINPLSLIAPGVFRNIFEFE